MRRLILRLLDGLITTLVVVAFAFGTAELAVILFAVDDPEHASGSIIGALNLFVWGAIGGAIVGALLRMVVSRVWPASRLANRFPRPA